VTGGERTIEYQPALDGVRAIAVVLVLLFHGGVEWMRGGYVGVSVFFTLSGYLITTLLLVERERSGRIVLGTFYARRMKRLLPASLLCLGAISIAAAAGAFGGFESLRRDLLGALFQVANWVKLADDATYADLTNATLGRVAPVEHYWSLAIEEQFYWLWPLVIVGLFASVRSTRRVTTAILVMTVAAMIAAPVIAQVFGPDAAYWSTPARAGEILVGASLGAVLLVRGPLRAWTRWLAPAGLAVIAWAAATWPTASGPAYEGWFPVFALASAGVIAGLQHASVFRTALSWRPLVWVGTISYGLYLYHWPLYAVLTESTVGLDGAALFAIRIAATVAVAALSFRLVEQPVRQWSPGWRRPLYAGALATVALALVVVIAVPRADTFSADVEVGAAATIVPVDGTLPSLSVATTVVRSETTAPPESSVIEGEPASTTQPESTTTLAADVPPPPVPVPDVSRPVRILTVGDSTSQATAVGLSSWAADHPDAAQLTDLSAPGCGFIRGGVVPTDREIDWQGPCDDLLDTLLPDKIAELQPDVVVLMVTMRDVEDREWAPSEGPLDPFDPRFRSRLLADYRALAARLFEAGVPRLAWVLPPHPIAAFGGEQRPMRNPERYLVQFDVIREVAASDPERIGVLDLQGWLVAMGQFRDIDLRPDGLHWTPEAARWLSDRFLAGSVIGAAVS
jgi:peptidoglycan/LPS O-acetylase OafA/YrhL